MTAPCGTRHPQLLVASEDLQNVRVLRLDMADEDVAAVSLVPIPHVWTVKMAATPALAGIGPGGNSSGHADL